MKENKTSLIIQSETELEIEVIGGFIYLDGTDVEMPRKVDKMYETYDEAKRALEQKELTIKKSSNDEKVKNEMTIDATVDFMESVYNAINKLFGKGACAKIFRSKSISAMENFLEQLPAILESLQVTTGAYLDKRLNKDKEQYAPITDTVSDEIEDI